MTKSRRDIAWVINHFLLLAYAAVLVVTRGYLDSIDLQRPAAVAFHVAAYLSHGLLYLLPALLLIKATQRLFAARPASSESRAMAWPMYALAAILVTVTLFTLHADTLLYELYGFHLNGFVWNLLTTDGGLASMGGEFSTHISVAALFAMYLIGTSASLWVLCQLAGSSDGGRLRAAPLRAVVAIGAVLYGAQAIAYGVSGVAAYTPILSAARSFPFYAGLSIRGLAGDLGFKTQRASDVEIGAVDGQLDYPLKPIVMTPPAKPLNIVWLVAESWRADTLNAEIMPATHAFSARAHHFRHHYSGGDGTRMGIFSMFYGLYAPYWFPFLDHQQGPVLIDALLAQDYQLGLFTSAKFTYPEFDRTVFAEVPKDLLIQDPKGKTWERDRRNVERLIDFISGRDRNRPFMTFMFFESPHAPYSFPPENTVRTPHADELNYANLDLDRDMELIRARYLNSCNHLDSQFARVLDFLKGDGLLENTIVVITGDHGEEFMEKGRWGHNSQFTEEQTRPPLVLWIPGTGHGEHTHITSHLDLPATLLPHLGVTNPPEDYSLGRDLLGDQSDALR